MRFLISLSKRPPSHQLLWVYLIGEIESGNKTFEPHGLCIRFDISQSTLKRVIAWGIDELNQERVVYRAFYKSHQLHIALGDVGYVKPQPKVIKDSETKKDTQVVSEAVEIIEYLNQVTGKNFKAKSKNAQRHISARLKEGYAVDDFKRVIDVKSQKWMGTSMEQFMRPETLFGSKFDGYLNESGIQNEQQSKFITTQRAVDEAKQFDFFGNQD